MGRDDIIRMAREANLPPCHTTHPKALERFANRVAAQEREECAKVCDDARDNSSPPADTVCRNLAHRIRAREEK